MQTDTAMLNNAIQATISLQHEDVLHPQIIQSEVPPSIASQENRPESEKNTELLLLDEDHPSSFIPLESRLLRSTMPAFQERDATAIRNVAIDPFPASDVDDDKQTVITCISDFALLYKHRQAVGMFLQGQG